MAAVGAFPSIGAHAPRRAEDALRIGAGQRRRGGRLDACDVGANAVRRARARSVGANRRDQRHCVHADGFVGHVDAYLKGRSGSEGEAGSGSAGEGGWKQGCTRHCVALRHITLLATAGRRTLR